MRRPAALALSIISSLALGLFAACSDDASDTPTSEPLPDGDLPKPGDGGDAGTDANASDAPLDDADAAVLPLYLGVTPNAGLTTEDGEVGATVTTLAAGSRVVVVRKTLAELSPEGLDDLKKRALLYGAEGAFVVLQIMLVDGPADLRSPEQKALPWDDASYEQAVDKAIDGAIGALGSTLRYVLVGRDVDRFFPAHPAESAAFQGLLTHVVGTAEAQAGDAIAVAVATTPAGVFAPPDELGNVLDEADVIATSLRWGMPGQTPFASATAVLDQLVAAAGSRPILIEGVSAASAPEAGSTPDAQTAFLDGFFQALAARRQAFVVVNIDELNDESVDVCNALAVAQGASAGGALAAYHCSIGLMDQDAVEKPGFATVRSALAAFASP